MCGIELHGFWWEIENAMREENYEVVFALEVNSHTGIKKRYTIPDGAYALGINPVNGKVTTNDSRNPNIPQKVKEKAELFFQMYRPNKETIAEHIRMNYAKNNDKAEWDVQLSDMLADRGRGLFTSKYYTQYAQDYTQRAQDYTQYAQDYTQYAQDYTQRAQDCTQQAQKYTQLAQECIGTLDEMDINRFLEYFLEHPNDYWKDRTAERKVEYKEFVRV